MSCSELWSPISTQLVLSCLCGHELQLDITPAFCTNVASTSGRATYLHRGGTAGNERRPRTRGATGNEWREGVRGEKGVKGVKRAE